MYKVHRDDGGGNDPIIIGTLALNTKKKLLKKGIKHFSTLLNNRPKEIYIRGLSVSCF